MRATVQIKSECILVTKRAFYSTPLAYSVQDSDVQDCGAGVEVSQRHRSRLSLRTLRSYVASASSGQHLRSASTGLGYYVPRA